MLIDKFTEHEILTMSKGEAKILSITQYDPPFPSQAFSQHGLPSRSGTSTACIFAQSVQVGKRSANFLQLPFNGGKGSFTWMGAFKLHCFSASKKSACLSFLQFNFWWPLPSLGLVDEDIRKYKDSTKNR